jgi:hypothetical protein
LPEQANQGCGTPVKPIIRRNEHIDRLAPWIGDPASRSGHRIEIACNYDPITGDAELTLDVARLVPVHYYDEIGVTD